MLGLSLLLLACNTESEKDTVLTDTGVNVEDTDSEDTDTEDTDDTGDTDTDTADTDTEDTETDEPAEIGLYRVQTSSQIIHQSEEGEQVSTIFRCLYETEDSHSILSPSEYTVTVSPETGTTIEADAIHFTEPGEYTVSCSEEENAISASVQITGEVLNPEIQAISHSLALSEMAFSDILLANNGADEELVFAYFNLQMARDSFPVSLTPFRDIPDAFWPTDEQLDTNGLGLNEDDPLLDQWILDTGGLVQQYIGLFQQMNHTAPTADQLDQLDALDVMLQTQVDLLDTMEPSLIGWRNNEALLNEVVLEPMRQMLVESIDWHIVQLESDADEILPPFGLASLTMSMAMKSSLRFRVANQLYGKAIKALDTIINQLVAIELISLAMPPVGDIEVTWFQLSSSNSYISLGYNSYLYGNGFSDKPGMNLVYFVTPDWQGTVDAALANCGAGSGLNLMEHLENAQLCRDASSGNGAEVSGLSVTADGVLGDYSLSLGNIPTDLCSGLAPVPIGVMVWNMESGARTEFHTLQCIP